MKKRFRFQTFKDVGGSWRFRIVSVNGEIVAQSEAYSSKQKCLQTIASMRRDIICWRRWPVEEVR